MSDGPIAQVPASGGATLAFSTLACPEWTASRAVSAAVEFGYDAIEWRGGDEGHVRTSWSQARRARLRREMADQGVAALCVTTYTSFLSPDAASQLRNRTHLERHIDLARDLGAPFVRAFAGIREDDAPESELRRRVAGELALASEAARDASVVIAIEQHDDFDRASQVAEILELLPDAPVGAIWDVANGWAAGESPADGFARIGDRLSYAQLKDGRGGRLDWNPTDFGQGTVPLGPAVELLIRESRAPICVEWIRAWAPELAPPEVALPALREYVLGLINAAAVEQPRSPAFGAGRAAQGQPG